MSKIDTLFLNFLCFWVVLSCLVATRAPGVGRSARRFFLISLVLSPLVGICWLLIVGVDRETTTLCPAGHLILKTSSECQHCLDEEAAAAQRSQIQHPKSKETVLCRACGERIPKPATQCEYCMQPTQQQVPWHLHPPPV